MKFNAAEKIQKGEYQKEKWNLNIYESDKSIDQFSIENNSNKHINIFFSDCSIQNFDYKDKSNLKINEFIFQDCNFRKHSTLNYSWNIDFMLVWTKENILNNFSIAYYNSSLFNNEEWINSTTFYFRDLNTEKFQIYDTSYWDLYYKPPTPKIFFKYIHIDSLIYVKDFLIDNVEIETLHIENFSPIFNNFELRNLTIWELIIENSNLGKIILNSVVINKLTIKNASIDEWIFNWVSFNSYELGSYINKLFCEKHYQYKLNEKQLKDNYRQLKHVMDKNWNHTEANKFYEKEMDFYWLTLWLEKVWFWWTLKQIFRTVWYGWENKKRGEKLSLLFSEIITEHWTNLTRWMFVLIVFALLSALIATGYIQTATYAINDKKINIWDENIFNLVWIWIILLPLVMSLTSKLFSYIYNISIKTSILKKIIKIEKKDKKELNTYDPLIFALLFTSTIIFGLLYTYSYSVGDQNYTFNSLKYFLSILDPTFWLFKNQVNNFTSIELWWFLIYKILYWIILWHIIVAAKRTTKR